MKALIPSVSYYGVLLSPLGGMLAKKYGGATIFGTSVAATGIVILMTPFLARQNMIIFISTRILKGIFHVNTRHLQYYNGDNIGQPARNKFVI